MPGIGPLPKPSRRRVNAATIPTTNLPAGGRSGPVPRVPKGLGAAGRAWWRWAWRTPQASAWDAGSASALARRARLEDLVAVLADEEWDWSDADEVRRRVGLLKSLVSGELGVLREMRELDDRFGLTPKGRLALRWAIQPDEVAEVREGRASSSRRLSAVDPAAVG